MNTVVYLICNAKTLKGKYETYDVDETTQSKSEKIILSIDGEKEAASLTSYQELNNLDVIFSSHYVRALSTAKYLASSNELLINVSEAFGEREIGSFADIDGIDYFLRQEHDLDYRLHNGESLNQVKKRMSTKLKEILATHAGENIAIISHNTAIMCLLLCWCEVGYNLEDRMILNYKKEALVDGRINNCTVFKLTFDETQLKDIRIINK